MGPQSNKVSTFKIFVSNLPNGITNENIRALFEPYGRVVESEVFIARQDSDVLKTNYAFVHMEDDNNCRQAVKDLNGLEIEGNFLSVVQSKNGQGPKIQVMKLAVSNIHPSIGPIDLRNLFRKFGYIVEAEVYNGCGHVMLEATGDIRSAINEISGFDIQGQALKVEPVHSAGPASTYGNNMNSPSSRPGKRKEPPPFARGGGSMPPGRGRNNKFAPYPHPSQRGGLSQRGGGSQRGPRGGGAPRGQRGGGPGRPPPSGPFFRPPQHQQQAQNNYSYDDNGQSTGYYGPQSNYNNDFACDDDPSYCEPQGRTAQQREQFFHDELPPPSALQNPIFFQDNPPNDERNSSPVRISRYRDNFDHNSSDGQNGDPYYNDFDHSRQNSHPMSSMHNITTPFQPQPLMAIDAVPPSEKFNNPLLSRTAKVTKYGKIVFNNNGANNDSRGRGGRGVNSRGKGKRVSLETKLSSLLDPIHFTNPIPGTIRQVDSPSMAYSGPPFQPRGPGNGNFRNQGGGGGRPQQQSFMSHPRPLMNYNSPRSNHPHPNNSAPGRQMMRPMMRPQRMPYTPTGSQKSMLALHHESKRLQQPSVHQQQQQSQQPPPQQPPLQQQQQVEVQQQIQQQQDQQIPSSLEVGGQGGPGARNEIDFTADVAF